jgi:sugar lactone lactonase YvrE
MTWTRRRLVLVAVLGPIGLLVAYLLAWPVRVDPEAWHPGPNPGTTGPFERNEALRRATWIARELPGPEAVAFGPDHRVYTGTADGRVVRMDRDGGNVELVVDTGGRPLGLQFDAAGRLVIADAKKGLLRLEGETLRVLASEHGGTPFRFVDDLDIADDGTIYFTDASSRWGYEQFKMDVIEHRPSGRLLAWREGGAVELVADGLYFANGVALAPDESYVLVVETASYRVTRVWLRGEKKGQRDVLVDNLPGFPDNVTWSEDRKAFWLAVGAPRDATLDRLGPHPFWRKVLARLPAGMQPKVRRHAFAFAFDERGTIVANLQYKAGDAYAPIASVIEDGGELWLGSFAQRGLAKVAAPAP